MSACIYFGVRESCAEVNIVSWIKMQFGICFLRGWMTAYRTSAASPSSDMDPETRALLQEDPHFKRLFSYVEGLRRTADDIEADIYERGRLLLQAPGGLALQYAGGRRPRKKSTKTKARRSMSKRQESSNLAEHLKSKTWGPGSLSTQPQSSGVAGGDCKRSCVREECAAASSDEEDDEEEDAEALAVAAEFEKEIEGLLDDDVDGDGEEPNPMGAELPGTPGVAGFLQAYGKQDPGVDPLQIMGIVENDDEPTKNGEFLDSDYDEE
jgi:hypothetical protein